jgi:hypothetical protein
MLIQGNLNQARGCCVNQHRSLLMIRELKQLLAKIVSEWI